MDDLKAEGMLALDILTEAATTDGYRKGFYSGDRNLEEWRKSVVGRLDNWSSVNPAYVDYPNCVYGLFLLAVEDREAYSRLVGEVAGDDPSTYEGLCGVYNFLGLLVDDHDYTVDPRDPAGARVTFDGPIGVDGVRGAAPMDVWEHVQAALTLSKDNVPSAPAMR